MYGSGKTHNIIKETNRLKIDIIGVSETHWPNSGQCKILDHTVYYSGNDNSQHRNGVGIVVSSRIQPTNDAPAAARHPPPTADKDDAVIKEYYEQLERLIKMTHKQEITIIMGDFNGKVGRRSVQAPQGISDSVKETKEGTVLYSSARIITYYSVTHSTNSAVRSRSMDNDGSHNEKIKSL
ncbi:hypothetical protein HUJ05_001891 [Dendroctonus ponderosae]|nr:hypothetical protein HUJ05_001891 [Dendroctonus ponderosae]